MTPLEIRVVSLVRSSEFTYGEIARKTGAQNSAVSKLAKTGKISITYFAKLCIALNVDSSLILYGKKQNVEEDNVELNELLPLQKKVIRKIRKLSKNDHYKLEGVDKLLS